MVSRNDELSAFLRASRARLRPEDVGLYAAAAASGRRVSGLRREEVANLANVSVDYYVRLEQGRTRQVSRAVLDSVAAALRLNPTEHDYLVTIAAPQLTGRPVDAPRERVRPGAHQLLQTFSASPAFIVGRGMKVLAMNPLARAALFDPSAEPRYEHSLALWTFLSPEAKERYVDWRQVASDTAAILRMDAAEYPDDVQLKQLVGQLTMSSDEFRQAWGEHTVYECTFGRKRLAHPVVGRIDVDYEAFGVPGSPGQKMFVYLAQNGSRSADALDRLKRWVDPATSPAELASIAGQV